MTNVYFGKDASIYMADVKTVSEICKRLIHCLALFPVEKSLGTTPKERQTTSDEDTPRDAGARR